MADKNSESVLRGLFYHDPEILILDEATSALDKQTEQEIFTTLKPLVGIKTLFIIAHQKASLNICDKIFEMREEGSKLHENFDNIGSKAPIH